MMNPNAAKEHTLAIWLETEPGARSPYQLYGRPPMWETAFEDGLTLFTRPAKTMVRSREASMYGQYVEVDGITWQWRRNENEAWVDQAYNGDFEAFVRMLSRHPAATMAWDRQTLTEMPRG